MSLTIEQLEAIVKDLQVQVDGLENAYADLSRFKRETINQDKRIRQLRETQVQRTRAKNKKKKEAKESTMYEKKNG